MKKTFCAKEKLHTTNTLLCGPLPNEMESMLESCHDIKYTQYRQMKTEVIDLVRKKGTVTFKERSLLVKRYGFSNRQIYKVQWDFLQKAEEGEQISGMYPNDKSLLKAIDRFNLWNRSVSHKKTFTFLSHYKVLGMCPMHRSHYFLQALYAV